MNNGFFVVAELDGVLRESIAEVQRAHDPRLAASSPPHVTLIGSSGVGPITLDTPVTRIREALTPALLDTPPLTVSFGPPMRFMQSNIVVLPLDPHGPLRQLHEAMARTDLPFLRARFPFTPHCTLTFYPALTRETERRLLALRVAEPFAIRALRVYRSINPMPYQLVDELPLGALVADT